MRNTSVIMLSGLTACGKTTAAQRLRDSYGFALLSTHAIKSAFGLRNTCSERERDLAYAELYRQARAALAGDRCVILDAGFNTRERREPVYRLAQTRGTRLYLVSCICDDLGVIVRRVEARRRAPSRPENQAWSMATYHHIRHTVQPVTRQELPAQASLLVYDTLDNSIEVLDGDDFARHLRRTLVRVTAQPWPYTEPRASEDRDSARPGARDG